MEGRKEAKEVAASSIDGQTRGSFFFCFVTKRKQSMRDRAATYRAADDFAMKLLIAQPSLDITQEQYKGLTAEYVIEMKTLEMLREKIDEINYAYETKNEIDNAHKRRILNECWRVMVHLLMFQGIYEYKILQSKANEALNDLGITDDVLETVKRSELILRTHLLEGGLENEIPGELIPFHFILLKKFKHYSRELIKELKRSNPKDIEQNMNEHVQKSMKLVSDFPTRMQDYAEISWQRMLSHVRNTRV